MAQRCDWPQCKCFTEYMPSIRLMCRLPDEEFDAEEMLWLGFFVYQCMAANAPDPRARALGRIVLRHPMFREEWERERQREKTREYWRREYQLGPRRRRLQ
jgi:hypothetical protein